MTRMELNNIFTAKVNSYLAKGYTFHLTSMSGSQGEIGKVDLTNGEEVIRILLTKDSEHNEDFSIYFSEVYTITVGRAIDYTPNWSSGNTHTLWNNKLEVLEEEKFYSASNEYGCDYLISYEEALANQEKHRDRYKAQAAQKKATEESTDKVLISALLPYLTSFNGCKSLKARHITKVVKTYDMDGHYIYRIYINRKGKESQKTLKQEAILKARMAN